MQGGAQGEINTLTKTLRPQTQFWLSILRERSKSKGTETTPRTNPVLVLTKISSGGGTSSPRATPRFFVFVCEFGKLVSGLEGAFPWHNIVPLRAVVFQSVVKGVAYILVHVVHTSEFYAREKLIQVLCSCSDLLSARQITFGGSITV